MSLFVGSIGRQDQRNPPPTVDAKPAPFYGYQPKNIFEAVNISSGRLQVVQVREPRGSQYTGGFEQQFIPTSTSRPSEPSRQIQPPIETLGMTGLSKRIELAEMFKAPFLQVGYSFTNWLGLTKAPLPQTPDFLDPNVSVQKKTGYVVGSAVLLGLASLGIGVGYEEAKAGGGYVATKVFGKSGPVSPGLVDVPDIGYTAPRTMSEKVLGLPESQATPLTGLKGMEAEATATSFGTMPRTALLDPEVMSLPSPPAITRFGWTPQSVFPYIPTPELTARTTIGLSTSVLPSILPSLAGLPIGKSQISTSLPKFETLPVTKVLTRTFLSPVERVNVNQMLKPSVALSSSVALAPMQVAETELMQKQILKPLQTQVLQPEFIQLPRYRTVFEQPNFDFFKFNFKQPRKHRGSAGARKGIWEFPIKGPRELLGF